MTGPNPPTGLDSRLQRARQLEQSGQTLQAELLYAGVLKDWPQSTDTLRSLSRLALQRGDGARAVQLLEAACRIEPLSAQLGLDLAFAHLAAERPTAAIEVLESTLAHTPAFHLGWLLLGEVHEKQGNPSGALQAWHQAVTRAQRAGHWKDEASTPPAVFDAVVHAIGQVRSRRRELLFGSYDALRRTFGAGALKRVDRALSGHLREWDATPPDARQRPKFFFFPDLPSAPYHDPDLQPWAQRLRSAFPVIRQEALRLLVEDRPLPNFIDVKDGDRMDNYLAAPAGLQPVWEAFFFYRHGERFDANHARCPQTSALLESIELCRIADQAPEICFSVLKPGTHILPHYGVTNTRLVMHLPLIVPSDCALNLIDAGEHRWREGELVMFDDTFQHEAWNRSDTTRIVLLMDCWNPHLTDVEKLAVKQLIETITELQLASRSGATARASAG